MLLAAGTSARAGERVVDFGAGVGAAGLALARRVAGIDAGAGRDRRDAGGACARQRGLERDRCRRAACSMSRPTRRHLPPPACCPTAPTRVMMNPPFNDAARHRASPDAARAAAHVARETTLQNWVHAARRILKSGGALTLDLARRRDCRGACRARSRLRQRRDPAGSWRGRRAGDPRPGSRGQGWPRADANPARPDAQG